MTMNMDGTRPQVLANRSVHFSEQYARLLTRLTSPEAAVEVNERTGKVIRALHGSATITVDLWDGFIPVCGVRRLRPHVAAAEVAWFLSGRDDLDWMRTKSLIWNKFTEEDGRTVRGAYGHRWRRHFGRDQIALAVEALRKNPSDRRVLVSAWDPAFDGLGADGQRSVPCPACFTLSVVDGVLHSTVLMRSSDVFVGLPYDVMGHAMLMHVLAKTIGCPDGVGKMTFTLAHPHLYGVHVDAACNCLEEYLSPTQGFAALKAWDLSAVEQDPDGFVTEYSRQALAVKWPSIDPRPELIV